jgi:hypothetical protein
MNNPTEAELRGLVIMWYNIDGGGYYATDRRYC